MQIFLLIIAIFCISTLINKVIWRSKITGKEMLFNLIVPLIMFAIFWAASMQNKISDTEILNGKVLQKTRDIVHCRHSYQCRCYTSCSGSGKHRNCRRYCSTCYEHSFDFDYNVKSNIGLFSIDTVDRQGLITPKRFASINIGDPVSKTHKYKNYLKGSKNSIFNIYGKMSKDEIKKIPKYPLKIYDYYNIDRVIDQENILTKAQKKDFNKKLSLMLADVGFIKKMNAVIVLTKKSDIYALNLLNQWYGGKKNDVIIIIGVTNSKIEYVRIHSWSLHSIFDVKLRDAILDIEYIDYDKIVKSIEYETRKDYIRRSFKEFEYLKWQIIPSMISIALFTIICLAISTLIGYRLSKN